MHNKQLTTGIIESKGDITLRDILAPLFRHKRLMIVSFSVIAYCINLSSIGGFRYIRSTYGSIS